MITQYRPAYYDNPRASTLSGLSTDQKPTDVENGAIYEEIDTGKAFCFDKENKAWYEMPQSGGGGSSVSVEPITITKNGVTTAPDGVAYSPITTDTYTQDGDKITITEDDGSMVVFTQGETQAEKTVDIKENGAFTVEPDAGFSFVRKVSGTVAVPTPAPALQEKSVKITSNGRTSVSPDAGKDGLSQVDITVAVPTPTTTLQKKSISITANGTGSVLPDAGNVGLSEVEYTVNVPAASGYQLKSRGADYKNAENNEEFISIVIQAGTGTLEPPSGWDFPMFPLGVLLYLENNPVICWCSTLVDNDTQEIKFPGTFYVGKKVGHIECRYFASSDGKNHFQVASLELGGENILSQITNTTIIGVSTLFPSGS